MFLIGDLPSAWFGMEEYFGFPDNPPLWVEFPIDLYFSDIDGEWIDSDEDSIFDVHTGNVHPDISIGRIKADNLLIGTEVEVINNYFVRNHLYRTGNLINVNHALAYIDDDWASSGSEYASGLSNIYSDVELINYNNQTTAFDYTQNRLLADYTNRYHFIQVMVHSSAYEHHFYENNGSTVNQFHYTDLMTINPQAYFYNLFACSNAHYESFNNMGGLYLLGNDYALGVIGSTKTGSMLYFESFYHPWSLGITIGEAFQQWWIDIVDTGGNQTWERSWFYGMVLLGDPTLIMKNLDDGSCEYNSGDLNCDGELNVLDVVALANCVLQHGVGEECYEELGDMNGDGVNNVLDIVTLVNLILS